MASNDETAEIRRLSPNNDLKGPGKEELQPVTETLVERQPSMGENKEGATITPSTDNDGDSMNSRGAALFMLAAFMIEAVQWSIGTSYGVFYRFYMKEAVFGNDKFLTTAGTLAVGIPFLGAPLATYATTSWRPQRRWMILGGWAICLVGIFSASFATQSSHIIVTQGLLYGIGFLILYYPMLDMLNEWFVKRRGLAYGILFAANGLGGAVLPLILNKLLDKYGFATVLRIYAVAIVVLTGPCLPFLKGRPGKNISSVPSSRARLTLPSDKLFWFLIVSSFFQALAFYVPFLYLPAFATTIATNTVKSALLLSLLNIATIIGQVAFGWLSDRMNVLLILAASTTISGVITATIWLLARNYAALAAYSILYGGAAGGFSVLYARFVTAISKDPDQGLWLYGLLAFVRGISYVISGPISGTMLPNATDSPSDYRLLIACVAGAFIISTLGGLGGIGRPVQVPPGGSAAAIEDDPTFAHSHCNLSTQAKD